MEETSDAGKNEEMEDKPDQKYDKYEDSNKPKPQPKFFKAENPVVAPSVSLMPPLNFSMVAPGVYRSGYPIRKNHSFLKKLRLKSILNLCPDIQITKDHAEFARANNIQTLNCEVSSNQEPFLAASEEAIVEALQWILDTSNHPMLVHCDKGKHRTGCLIGCLRKLQNWSLVPIFNEYAHFAGGTRARLLDKQFIEFFAPGITYDKQRAPSWIDTNQKIGKY